MPLKAWWKNEDRVQSRFLGTVRVCLEPFMELTTILTVGPVRRLILLGKKC